MSGPIVIIDTSDMRQGRLADAKAGMTELARSVEGGEPRAIACKVYLDERGSTVTIFRLQPGSASAEYHMELVGPAFSGFADLLVLRGIEVAEQSAQADK
jgi:hypothetical protein